MPQSHDDLMRAKGYVTPQEAAKMSSTPRPTIYSWIRAGRLRTVKVGAGRGRVYLSVEDLRGLAGAFMEAQRVAPAR